jgi:HD-GYP domain-containing protein (c-di-GMP phosphodiesterase class II)
VSSLADRPLARSAPSYSPPHAERTDATAPLLLAAAGHSLPLDAIARRGDGAHAPPIEVRAIPSLPSPSSLDPERPTVVVASERWLTGAGARAQLEELAEVAAVVAVGREGAREPGPDLPSDLLAGWVAADASRGARIAQLRAAFRHAATLVAARRVHAEEARRTRDLADLARIGASLATERDLHTLLDAILVQARRLTSSDAGSLYLVDRDAARSAGAGAPTTLRFKLAHNDSLPALRLEEFTVTVDDASVAGHAALTGRALVVDDAYRLAHDAPYRLNTSFDDRSGYRTRSMLVIPMVTQRGETAGVLQLLNRKRRAGARLVGAADVEREVVPYDARDVELVSALAAQAGVAIENSVLYGDIERLFEGFVTAAVTAIEARDPTTSGHSARVATMTVALAESVQRAGQGPWRGLTFTREQLRELRYAGLLHDFGKVGVREKVLVKRKKLYSGQLELIRHRFAHAIQEAELAFERARADHLLAHGQAGYASALARLEGERATRRAELRRWLDLVLSANEPTVVDAGSFETLDAVRGERWRDVDGVERPLLEEEELRFLMVRRGNLDERERREIESHVTHTYRFLEQIPWTAELRGIPEIAYAHHEKLNGRGYPRALGAEAIPVQARMMTIADIFDALTAADRPYKRAVSAERALDILHDEAREGMLDAALLATFVEARVWDTIAPDAH